MLWYHGKKLFFVILCSIVCTALFAVSNSFFESGIPYARDCGAKGDGKTDDTLAIQSVLNKAGKAHGRIVELGIGNYLCKGHLDIPENVSLRGNWQIPTACTENLSLKMKARAMCRLG